jgi:hypothetical protein
MEPFIKICKQNLKVSYKNLEMIIDVDNVVLYRRARSQFEIPYIQVTQKY